MISGCGGFRDIFTSHGFYPITLYVDNTNRGLTDSLNIIVTMYSDTIVNQNFSTVIHTPGVTPAMVSSGTKMSEYNLHLTAGDHQIVVSSKNGHAGLDVVFTVDEPLWLMLSYWGDHHFQLHINKRPLVFM